MSTQSKNLTLRRDCLPHQGFVSLIVPIPKGEGTDSVQNVLLMQLIWKYIQLLYKKKKDFYISSNYLFSPLLLCQDSINVTNAKNWMKSTSRYQLAYHLHLCRPWVHIHDRHIQPICSCPPQIQPPSSTLALVSSHQTCAGTSACDSQISDQHQPEEYYSKCLLSGM